MNRADARRRKALDQRHTIELVSPSLVVEIDVERGGQVRHIGRPGGKNVLFHADWSTPLPATGEATYGSDALDWLSHYRGGWQVMFPNAGAATIVDDVPLPLHGEVSTARQTVRDVTPTSATLESATRRPLRLERRISIGVDRPVLRIEERAMNDADWPMAVAWGQHPAFEAPMGMTIDLPSGPVRVDTDLLGEEVDIEPGASGEWPLVPALDGSQIDLSVVPAGPVERVAYLPDRTEPWAALRDPRSGHGVAMAWDGDAYAHLWLWQQLGGRRFPFFGRARIVALEPVNIWPSDGLAAALGRGQGTWIAPGERSTSWITLRLFEGSQGPVVRVERDGSLEFGASSSV